MLIDKIREKLENEISKIIEDYGFEVIEVQVQNLKNGILLRVFIDSTDGRDVTLKDCEYVSKLIDSSLETEIEIATLEVSSPGIDRLIKKKKDFERFKGSNIKVLLNREIKNKKKLIGKLKNINEDIIELEYKGETLFIPLSYIKEARLHVSDEEIKNYLKRRKV